MFFMVCQLIDVLHFAFKPFYVIKIINYFTISIILYANNLIDNNLQERPQLLIKA